MLPNDRQDRQGSERPNVFRFAPECMDPPCVARENGEPGVRSCTNVSGLDLELVLRTIMEIRAHPILLAAMPLSWHRPHGSLRANTPISRLGLSEDNLLRLHS